MRSVLLHPVQEMQGIIFTATTEQGSWQWEWGDSDTKNLVVLTEIQLFCWVNALMVPVTLWLIFQLLKKSEFWQFRPSFRCFYGGAEVGVSYLSAAFLLLLRFISSAECQSYLFILRFWLGLHSIRRSIFSALRSL